MTETDLLAGIPLFAGIARAHLETLAALLRRRRFAAGEVVFDEGDPGTALYILEAGQVKIRLMSPDGREVVLAVLRPHDFFGELALIDEQPRSADAVVRTASEVLVLNRDDFVRCAVAQPQIALNALAAVSRRLRRTDQIIADAVFLDVRTRLARLLLDLVGQEPVQRTPDGGIVLGPGLTQNDVAEMLGATRESINKWLRHYEDRGIVRRGRGRITIISLDALRREAS